MKELETILGAALSHEIGSLNADDKRRLELALEKYILHQLCQHNNQMYE